VTYRESCSDECPDCASASLGGAARRRGSWLARSAPDERHRNRS
jgi:hypothetical protein